MDERLKKLSVTIIESSRGNTFTATDGEVESELFEFTLGNMASIQNAINKALASYKDKIEQS